MWRLNLQSHFCRISLNSTRQTCGVWIRRETRINWSKLSENLSIIISERMIFLFPSEEREKIGRPLLFLSKTFFFWKFFLIPWIIFWSSKNNKNQTFKTFRKFYRKKRISPAGGCFCQPQSRSCKNDLVHLIEYDANATLISKKDGFLSWTNFLARERFWALYRAEKTFFFVNTLIFHFFLSEIWRTTA